MKKFPILVSVPALALALACVLGALALPAPCPAADAPPAGWIVFDSNRAGGFDIWKMRSDGSRVTRLTDHPDWEMYPDWSPDGQTIVFARHRPGKAKEGGDLYLMDADGGNQRRVARQATFPQFIEKGAAILFERNRREVFRLDLRSGEERRVFPPKDRKFKGEMVKPRLAPDGRNVAFTSDRGGRWTLWTMDVGGQAARVGSGCEGTWSPDGSGLIFVSGDVLRENAILRARGPTWAVERLLTVRGSHPHLYFPSFSPDGAWVFFGGSPAGQHDHFTANYQIFVAPVAGGAPRRLTENKATDRWPRLFPDPR